jgi:hypothetical protein
VPWLLFAESGAFLCFGIAWYVKGAAAVPRGHMPPRGHSQAFVQALSRTIPRWLADEPAREPARDSAPTAAGQA